jgi:hypothetical protein
VLIDDTHEEIAQSDVRIADDLLDPNQHITTVSADGKSESKIILSTDSKIPVFTP